eukprot:2631822-Amphidinium_carterae.2
MQTESLSLIKVVSDLTPAQKPVSFLLSQSTLASRPGLIPLVEAEHRSREGGDGFSGLRQNIDLVRARDSTTSESTPASGQLSQHSMSILPPSCLLYGDFSTPQWSNPWALLRGATNTSKL